MTKQGALLPVTVEGLHEVYLVQPDHLEQTLTAPPDSAQTAATVHLVAEKDPGESEMELTLPVGVTLPPLAESVIVAVQLEA